MIGGITATLVRGLPLNTRFKHGDAVNKLGDLNMENEIVYTKGVGLGSFLMAFIPILAIYLAIRINEYLHTPYEELNFFVVGIHVVAAAIMIIGFLYAVWS